MAQTILNVIDHGFDVRTAVDAPRIHHQLFPDEIQVENNGVDSRTLSILSQMGHSIAPHSGYFGNVQLIIRRPEGMLHGASDPRREAGRALGY